MKRHIALALLAGGLMLNMPALAAGGGGGGSSAPTSTGPTYDPVKEYQDGVIHLQDGDYKKAERAFKRVVKVAKTDANSHYLLGLAHYGQEEWKPATKSLAKAVKLNGDLHDARARLALAYLKRDEAEKAQAQIAALKAAKETCADACPDAAKIAQSLALVAPKSATPADTKTPAGEADEAESIETSSLSPDITLAASAADAVYLDAIRLINLTHYEAAIEKLQAAQSALGPHPDVLTYLGFAHRKAGEFELAYAYYQAALEIDPHHINANEYLGEYYVELGNMPAAFAQLEKLEEICVFGCPQAIELLRWIDQAQL